MNTIRTISNVSKNISCWTQTLSIVRILWKMQNVIPYWNIMLLTNLNYLNFIKILGVWQIPHDMILAFVALCHLKSAYFRICSHIPISAYMLWNFSKETKINYLFLTIIFMVIKHLLKNIKNCFFLAHRTLNILHYQMWESNRTRDLNS